jgi:hypothetical protein
MHRLPFLAAACALTWLLLSPPAAAAEGWQVVEAADRLRISWNREPVADFVFGDRRILRPYFQNVRASDGTQVTRNQPPVQGVDADDHETMHPGIWLAFGDISGADFWRNKGRMEHLRFIAAPAVEADRLTFATECRLLNDGVMLGSITNQFELRAGTQSWLLVWEATFRSETGDLVFGDQEEMGFGVRVATPLAERNGGLITSSTGLKTAKENWGQPADWCDYSGLIEGRRAGVLAMADPGNFRASWWHNRDYGLMVANPFGREAMRQGERSAVVIKRGESMRLRFGARVYSLAPGAHIDAPGAYGEFVRSPRRGG